MQIKTSDVSLLEPAGSSPVAAGELSPSISVIMPNYNHGKWLARALDALVAQTGPSMEIIVIDDGSTDNSVEVITEFCKRHGRVRLIRHDVNRKIFAAMRTGIAVARGEFVLFAAADDFVLPGLLARAEAALRMYPNAAFYCAEAALVDRAGHVVGYRPIVPPRFTSGYVSPIDVRREILRSDNWFIGPSVIYRRRLLAEIGYFDESLGTLCDALAQRLLAFRHGFYFDADTLVVWMVDAASLSAQTSLSVGEGRRVIEQGALWIALHFPPDIRDCYRKLFERRLRFNMARHHVVWRSGAPDTNGISDLLELSPRERLLLGLIGRVPFMGPLLLLVFTTLRMRPVSLVALLKSWWRVRVVQRRERAALEGSLAQACVRGVV